MVGEKYNTDHWINVCAVLVNLFDDLQKANPNANINNNNFCIPII